MSSPHAGEVAVPTRYRPRALRWTRHAERLWSPIESLGHTTHFVVQAVLGIGHALRRHRRHAVAIFTDLTWGNGRAVIVGGGVAPVLAIMGIVAGGVVGIVGFSALDMLGMGPLAGAMSALANPRELAPLIAAVGFAAQAGCRITAEVGAMRISEEIDALESQAIDPIPYVVSTRIIAAVAAVIPSYLIALALGFATTGATVALVEGNASGAYDHYFHMFTEPIDLIYSLIKVVVFVLVVTLVHAYEGFHAGGGPEGVGIASGRAIRASLVLIVTTDMILTLCMWGLDATVSFSG
ncbi:ABC transporter permease [Nocardia shimofusensis]|uniref:ABC transporter permease n=1 Tax=Nocardia shimofusensis TaxID=228596 RepID=UPI00082D4C07|nr:ABC transporter permease [Nocardia shimofusensis]